MRKRTSHRAVRGLARSVMVAAAAGAVAALAAPPAAAQVEREECRCVDASGEEIENCRCFTVPRIELNRGFALAFEPPRARIGVSVGGDATEDDEPRGVVLRDVVEGSPADEAGLRAGDVVTRVDGRSVLEPLGDEEERAFDPGGSMPVQRFVRMVGRLEPGEEIPFEYLRDGETRRTTVVPERARGLFGAVSPGGNAYLRGGPGGDVEFFSPEGLRGHLYSFEPGEEGTLFEEGEGPLEWRFGGPEASVRVLGRGLDPCFSPGSGSGMVVVSGSRCVDGLQLQDLGPQLAEYFDVEEGVLVVEVAEDSTLGLRAGDVVRAIDGRDVEDVADVRRILRSYEEDEPVELTVVRRGETLVVRGTRR